MNRHFVNVLLDREEYPDVDLKYSGQLEALSVRVGWPMTIFLNPDGTAFLPVLISLREMRKVRVHFALYWQKL